MGRHAGTVAVAIGPEDNRADKQAEINRAAEAVDTGSGVVIVTDIHGGTPSNLACGASRQADRIVLCGANLPMLIKLSKGRGKSLKVAVTCALDAGRKYMNSLECLDAEGVPARP